MKLVSSIALATTLVLGVSSTALAVEVISTLGTGPVGNCQAALPAYEGQTRKRPLAVMNEGTTNAFVTCAYSTEENAVGVRDFKTAVTNISSVVAVVNCTAVIGEEQANAVYIPKSVTLSPGATGEIAWTQADNGGTVFAQSVAISCNLPPLVGLNRNRVTVLISAGV